VPETKNMSLDEIEILDRNEGGTNNKGGALSEPV
jgi:hypothetical protein